MERTYLVANTTRFSIVLKELDAIIPAKTTVNLYELAPELTEEKIKQEEEYGVLAIRLKYGMLVLIKDKSEVVKKKASEKKLWVRRTNPVCAFQDQ